MTAKLQRHKGATHTQMDNNITYRHLLSLISLILFLIHTHDVHLSNCYELLRSYSKISQLASTQGYDHPLQYLDDRLLTTLRGYVEKITALDTAWSEIPDEPSAPPMSTEDYGIIVNSDACAEGWAAIIHQPHEGRMWLIRQRWRGQTKTRFDLSTVSEPVALYRALQWVRNQPWFKPGTQIAAITDHAAIVSGQERWWSGNGGFSQNPYLNSCFATMHALKVTAFFIAGTDNPADAPSRSSSLGPIGPITATTVSGQMCLAPPLAELEYPFGLTDDEEEGDSDDDDDPGSKRFSCCRERPRLTG